LVSLFSASMIYYHLAIFVPVAIHTRSAQGFGQGYSFGDDFYPIWCTTREALFHHHNPYSAEMTRQIQSGLFGRALEPYTGAAPANYRAFSYPAFVDLLFWPLALLSFFTARIVLAIALPLMMISSIALWFRMLRLRLHPLIFTVVALLTLSSYAVLEGLFAEQMGLVVGFILAAALAMIVEGKLFFPGILLALALIKPQMMALIACYFLLWSISQLRTRWPLVAGFLATSAVLVGSSLLVWPRWISQWLQMLFDYRAYSTPPLASYILGGHIGSRFSPLMVAVLLLAAITLAWGMRHANPVEKAFRLTISLLLAITTVTLLPGHAVYDHVVLLPGILLIASSWRRFAPSLPARVILGFTALTLFWQWIFAPFVIAIRFFSGSELTRAVIMLPIRTAASIPFAVLAVLALLAWQSRTREQRRSE
jgi:hypothetical protein